jgi:radical SAM protein with 4Fe4S-binding SPASM domain
MIPDFDCGPWAPGHLVKYEGEMERVFEYWAAHRDIAVNTIDKTIRQLTQKTARTHLCRVGTMIVGITIDGDIYPCHDFAGRYAADPEERRTLLIGSVDNGYCQNLATFQDLAVNLDGASEVGRNCTACWAKWACSRGCPYMNYARAHDARTVNSAYCAMTRINCSIALRWMSVLTEYRFVNSRNPLVVKKKRDATREKDPVVSENTPADSRFGRIGARTSETGRNAASVDSVGTVD